MSPLSKDQASVDLVRMLLQEPHVEPQSKRELLWEAVEESSEELTPSKKDKLFQSLLEYEDIFAENSADLGHTTKIHPMEGAQPVRQQLRRILSTQRGEVKNLLYNMMRQDVIQPSSSPWASPVVLVILR